MRGWRWWGVWDLTSWVSLWYWSAWRREIPRHMWCGHEMVRGGTRTWTPARAAQVRDATLWSSHLWRDNIPATGSGEWCLILIGWHYIILSSDWPRCLAENNHIHQPPATDIVIEMNLPVLDIRLVSLPSPLQADNKVEDLLFSEIEWKIFLLQYEVLCQAVGGHPAPDITWSLTSAHGIISNLSSASAPQLSARGNLSTSLLELEVGLEDHDSVLTCSASIPSTSFRHCS